MLDIRNILLATDFEKGSEAAGSAAIELAWVAASKVALCHVLEFQFVHPDVQQRMQKRLGFLLDEMRTKFEKERVEVIRTSLPVGHPVFEVIREAQEVNAGLIVVGAGPSEASRFRVGPVAESIMLQSPISVLAVRPGDPPPAFRKVLCAVDLSTASRESLQSAILLAKHFAAQLIVLMVQSPSAWSSTLYEAAVPVDMENEYRATMTKALDDFLKDIDFKEVKWSKQIREGIPATEIVNACREQDIDVLVMGAIGGTGISRLLLGSVSRRVLRNLPCSILIAR